MAGDMWINSEALMHVYKLYILKIILTGTNYNINNIYKKLMLIFIYIRTKKKLIYKENQFYI